MPHLSPVRLRRRRAASILPLLALAAACDGDPGGTAAEDRPVALAAGSTHTCALTGAGTAYCWGANAAGQLGDGTRTSRAEPAAVAAPERFTAISAAGSQTCAVGASGSVYCWGTISHGGDPARALAGVPTPSRVPSDVLFADVSAGDDIGNTALPQSHSCALSREGRAYCWGHNRSGELGDATGVSAPAPVAVSTSTAFASIQAAPLHSCGVVEGGPAQCWGSNIYRVPAPGSHQSQLLPAAVAGGRAFTSFATGTTFACGVAEADVYCWGENRAGELGRVPSFAQTSFPVAQSLNGLPDIRDVFAPRHTMVLAYACALAESGEAYCWGKNRSGEVGIAPDAAPSGPCSSGFVTVCVPTPVPAAAALRFRTLALGTSHTCGITREHEIHCWGRGGEGQRGPAGIAGGPTPARVELPES